MSIESLKRRLERLSTAKHDLRHGVADRLAAAKAMLVAKRAERVRMGLPADLTAKERTAELSAWLNAHEHCAQASGLARKLYQAKRRMLRHLEAASCAELESGPT